MKTVFTGFGVILAISARRSFAPASVCFASTTMTLVLPTMIVLLPPAPPRPAHTFGFSIFMVIGGGACCAIAEMDRAHNNTTAPRQRIFDFDIVVYPFVERTLLPRRRSTQTTSSFHLQKVKWITCRK